MKYSKILTIGVFLLFVFGACKNEKQRMAEQIKMNEQKIFNDSTKMLNMAVANSQLSDMRKYADTYPDDSSSAVYLFKAADLAQMMRKNREALDIYSQFISKYPGNPKAASCLFLKAFIYDAELKQKDSAKILYREFLEKYPTHSMAPSAKASLDQIEMGLTDEEQVRIFQARIDSAEKAKTAAKK